MIYRLYNTLFLQLKRKYSQLVCKMLRHWHVQEDRVSTYSMECHCDTCDTSFLNPLWSRSKTRSPQRLTKSARMRSRTPDRMLVSDNFRSMKRLEKLYLVTSEAPAIGQLGILIFFLQKSVCAASLSLSLSLSRFLCVCLS